MKLSISIVNTYKSDKYHQSVTDFWNSLQVLPANIDPKERVQQLVHVALEKQNVIGVTTAERTRISHLGNQYMYAFRVLIHPDYRKPGLHEKLTLETRNFLESLYQKGETDCIGLITVVQNKSYQKNKRKLVYPATKLFLIGQAPDGNEIRAFYFKGALLN